MRSCVRWPSFTAAGRGWTTPRHTPIQGRPAFSVTFGGDPTLVWEYAPDAYAVISPMAHELGTAYLTSAELRQIAMGFHPGVPQPAAVPFRVTSVPSGFRLAGEGCRSYI